MDRCLTFLDNIQSSNSTTSQPYNNKTLNRNTTVKAVGSGKTLTALEVLSLSIRYLKDNLMKNIRMQGIGIQDSDIKCVLTVPAILDDKAKQFMREAAYKGGICVDQLSIISEPEAALIYCRYQPVESGATSGRKYMVLDLGGNVDIAFYQQDRDGTLCEFLPAKGGPFGGKSVDDAFYAFLSEIIGQDNLRKMQEWGLDDYIDLFRQFECKKRAIYLDKPAQISINIPIVLTEIMRKDSTMKTMSNAVNSSPYGDEISFRRQKLFISNKQFQKLFKPTIDGIIKIMEGILNEEMSRDIENILMVGGFAECALVQNAIHEKFRKKRIIVPDNPDLAVVNGAVLFGHVPRTISSRSRVAHHTYGTQGWPLFDPRRHPLAKLVVVNGEIRCKDAFVKYIEIGQPVCRGHVESEVFQVLHPDEAALEYTVYASNQRDPILVDDEGCTRLGFLTVPLDPNRSGTVEIEETLVFEGNTICMQAKDMTTGTIYKACFDVDDGI